MSAREQLLKTLMSDLEAMKLPERFSEEKKAEVMRGRKGQAAIDQGRAEIRANEKQYQDAVDKRDKLSERLQGLQTQIDAEKKTAKEDDPLNKAAQYGKSLGIPAAGYAAGHAMGAKFGRAFDMPADERKAGVKSLADQLRGVNKTAPNAKAQADAIVNTYDQRFKRGRGAAQFLAPAALAASSVATQKGAEYVDDPTLKEGLGLAANAERYGAAGMALQQTIDTLRGGAEARRAVDPTDVASIESARRQVNTGGKFDKVQGALAEPEPPKPAPAAPAGKPAPKPGTRPALLEQAKKMGLDVNTKTKKADLESALSKALRSTSKRVKNAPKALAPIAAGLGVYDALRSPAEAAGNADVGGFAAERLVPGGDTMASVADAYGDYVKYAKARGETPIPQAAFLRQLRDQGVGLARVAGADRLLASLSGGEVAATAAEPMASRGVAAAAGAGTAAATGGLMAGAKAVGSRVMQTPGLGAALRGLGRVAGPAAGALTAYDLGNMVVDENAKPDQLLEGAQDGAMPATPGNPGFMEGQQRQAQQAYGQADPVQVTEDDFAPVLAAAEQDPELAEQLRQIIMQRLAEAEEANGQQIPNALASQSIAGGGDMAAALRNFGR